MFLQPNAARTETFEYGGFAAVEKRLRNEWVHRRMKALFPECSRFVYSTSASGGDGWDSKNAGRLRQEALEEGLLVPSDVPDGLTIINGSEIAAQFENSEDYRHL